MGGVILLTILFFLVGCIISGSMGFSTEVPLLFLTLGFGIGFLIGFSNEVISENKIEHDLVVVNGYYVDPTGNFVTVDNIRATVNSVAIPERVVKTPPVIIEQQITYKKSFWKFGGNETKYYIQFPEE